MGRLHFTSSIRCRPCRSLLFSGIDGETQQFIYPLPLMPFSPRELKIGTELSALPRGRSAPPRLSGLRLPVMSSPLSSVIM